MKYFVSRIKTVFRIFPRAFALSLVLVLLSAVVAVGFLNADGSSQDKQKLTVGIVGNTQDTFLGFGIDVILKMDSTEAVMNVESMTESDAKFRLNNGAIAAYIVVPDGFVASITSGEVLPLDYVCSQTAGGVGTVFRDEILTAVSRMLVHSQKGVYGMQRIAYANGLHSAVSKSTEEMNLRYFSLMLNRPNVLTLNVSGISSGLSLDAYLLCGLSVLAVAFFGISYSSAFVRNDMTPNRSLARGGIGALKQIVCEYFAYFIAMATQLLLLSVCVSAFVGAGAFGDIELSLLDALAYAPRMLPALLCLTAFQFLCFTVASRLSDGIMLQFVATVVLGYIGGCMYPSDLLPKGMKVVGNLFPIGATREYLCEMLSGIVSTYTIVTVSVSFGVCLLFSVFARKIRVNKV
ncbi:MAG: ABC transporter permease [Clostridia bacterium]|nr:ABC transporter permease [Clostridia bacterium]